MGCALGLGAHECQQEGVGGNGRVSFFGPRPSFMSKNPCQGNGVVNLANAYAGREKESANLIAPPCDSERKREMKVGGCRLQERDDYFSYLLDANPQLPPSLLWSIYSRLL